jgi:hypothetical protein
MKYLLFIICCCYCYAVIGQLQTGRKITTGLGLAAPELIHGFIGYRIANVSQLGLSIGAGPSYRSLWWAISLEHRLYLGSNNARTGVKAWFFRQGTTFFPQARAPQRFTLNFTGGKDIPFKKITRGMTIDAGVFYLSQSEQSSIILVRKLKLWPALRLLFYFY